MALLGIRKIVEVYIFQKRSMFCVEENESLAGGIFGVDKDRLIFSADELQRGIRKYFCRIAQVELGCRRADYAIARWYYQVIVDVP